MTISLKHGLAALLCCGAVTAQAEPSSVGDYWLIHQQGGMYKNEAFVVDGEPANIFQRPGGIRSLGVFRLYEEGAKPTMTAYDVEVDCAKNRVRLKGAQNVDKFYNDIRPVKVSTQWQKKPETWLAQSRDFLCQPSQRQAKFMIPMGKMLPTQMVATAPGLFQLRNREHSRDLILKMVDQAFDQMPARNAPAKEVVR